ncbi:MAG: phage holin family protein [Methylobacter sp.]
MERNAANTETIEQAASDANAEKISGILENAKALGLELYGFSYDCFQLMALEARRAGRNLVSMIIAGMMAAVLLISAWLGLLAAAVLWLIEHGVVASSAILLTVVATLLLTLILIAVIRRKSRYLQFPATIHSLQLMPSQKKRDKEKS